LEKQSRGLTLFPGGFGDERGDDEPLFEPFGGGRIDLPLGRLVLGWSSGGYVEMRDFTLILSHPYKEMRVRVREQAVGKEPPSLGSGGPSLHCR